MSWLNGKSVSVWDLVEKGGKTVKIMTVVAIAKVGLYWWWFQIQRPTKSRQASGSVFEPSNTGGPSNASGPHMPMAPFIMGTQGSAKAILEIKTIVDGIVYHGLQTEEDIKNDACVKEFLDDFRTIAAAEGKGSTVDPGVSGGGGLDGPGTGGNGRTMEDNQM